MPGNRVKKPSSALVARYGPWAIVAGASEGLGAAFAGELARRQFHLVLIARNAGKLSSLSAELTGHYGVQVRTLSFDLAEADTFEKIGARTADLDIGLLVYNAAFAPAGPFLSGSIQEQQLVLATNCRAPVLLTHMFASRMRLRYQEKRQRGGIILMSSLAGFQGSPYLAHYAATKAYNTVLAEGLREELKELGVDVLACCAGAVATPGLLQKPQAGKGSDFLVMKPEKVAVAALRSLGTRALKIPGLFNSLGSFFMRRLLPRQATVVLMKNVVKNLI